MTKNGIVWAADLLYFMTPHTLFNNWEINDPKSLDIFP